MDNSDDIELTEEDFSEIPEYIAVPKVVRQRMTRTRKHNTWRQIRSSVFFVAAVVILLSVARAFFVGVMYVPSASMEPTLPVGTRLFYLKDVGQLLDVALSHWWNLLIFAALIVIVIIETFITIRKRIRGGRHVKVAGRIISAACVCLLLLVIALVPHHAQPDWQRATNSDIIIFADSNGWLSSSESESGSSTSESESDGKTKYLVKRIIAVGGQKIVGTKEGEIYVDGKKLDEPYLPEGVTSIQKTFEVTVPEGKLWVMGDNRGLSKDSRYYEGDTRFIDRRDIVAIPLFILDLPWDAQSER